MNRVLYHTSGHTYLRLVNHENQNMENMSGVGYVPSFAKGTVIQERLK